MHRLTLAVTVLLLGLAANTTVSAQSYHVAANYTLGGDGSWDYLTYDETMHRLYIGRSDRIMVVDPEHGKLIGEIPGFNRAHGVAVDEAAGRGFATSGGDGMVIIFDLKTLKVLGRTKVDMDDDAIQFDPATGHIFTFNGDAHSASVIDPVSGKLVGTIPLGAKPEFGVSDGHGKMFVNLESTSEVAEIDASAMKVVRKWPLAPCESPSGMAIDPVNHILFSGCHNQVMAMSDALAGKVVATVPIGKGVDACRYDLVTGMAFASTGDGSITVIHKDSPTSFSVVQTVRTQEGARTMGLDPATHRLFTVSAEHEGKPEPGHHHAPVKPGTFRLMVLEP